MTTDRVVHSSYIHKTHSYVDVTHTFIQAMQLYSHVHTAHVILLIRSYNSCNHIHTFIQPIQSYSCVHTIVFIESHNKSNHIHTFIHLIQSYPYVHTTHTQSCITFIHSQKVGGLRKEDGGPLRWGGGNRIR